MRSIRVSDDAWVVLKSKQVELMKVTGKVQTIGTVASDIIVKSNQEGEYKRGRVEELKELHNKMCFKHFDSKSMNPERYSAVKEYVEKRLLELQEGENHD